MPFGTRPKRPIKRTKHVDEIHVPTADEIQVAKAARLTKDLEDAQEALVIAKKALQKAHDKLVYMKSEAHWEFFYSLRSGSYDEKTKAARLYVEQHMSMLIPTHIEANDDAKHALAAAEAEVELRATAITLEKAKTKAERGDAKAVAEHKFFEARDREERAERRLEKANDKYKLATHEREQAWVELRKHL